MNLPFVLDVAIGLVFIYLILSLLASEIQELITTLFQWRAKHLKESIENLLSGGSQETEVETQVVHLVNELYSDPLLKNINQEAKGAISKGFRAMTWVISNLYSAIFSRHQPRTFGRDEQGKDRRSGPSYISSETFATTLIETLGISQLLEALVETRLEKFQDKILQGIANIAEKSEKELEGDESFQLLQEEFIDIREDFRKREVTLLTSLDRLSEVLDRFLASYPNSDEISNQRFLSRVASFKLGLFGKNNERAILSGGLKPGLDEIVEAINTTSHIHQELSAAIARKGEAYQQSLEILQRVPPSVKESLGILARRAKSRVQTTGNELNQLTEEISLWFDRSMSRASGVYKRNAKGVAILIGFALALITNADTFHIFERLSSDESLRQVVTQRAAQIAPRPGDTTEPVDLRALKKETDQVLKDIALPVGWNAINVSQQFECPTADTVQPRNTAQVPRPWDTILNDCFPKQPVLNRLWAGFRILLGWVISGIAISMGAPFWFDLLGKVVNVRNSGSKPASSNHQRSESTPATKP